jgi:hypothetical protein
LSKIICKIVAILSAVNSKKQNGPSVPQINVEYVRYHTVPKNIKKSFFSEITKENLEIPTDNALGKKSSVSDFCKIGTIKKRLQVLIPL